MKKIEIKPQTNSSISSSVIASTNNSTKELSPFEQMKSALRNNLKGLKKEEEKEGGD
jgi:hypothetical protein